MLAWVPSSLCFSEGQPVPGQDLLRYLVGGWFPTGPCCAALSRFLNVSEHFPHLQEWMCHACRPSLSCYLKRE